MRREGLKYGVRLINLTQRKKGEKSMPYYSLYRYATKRDILFIIISVICALSGGILIGLNGLVYASFINNVIMYVERVYAGNKLPEIGIGAHKFALQYCMIGLGVVILTYISTVLMTYVAWNQIVTIRSKYFEALLHQDMSFFNNYETGQIASFLSDHFIVMENGIGECFASILYYIAASFTSIFVCFITGWQLTCVCLSACPFLIIFLVISLKVSSKLTHKELQGLERASVSMEQALSAVDTVYAYNGQQNETKRYAYFLGLVKKVSIKKVIINGLIVGGTYFSAYLSFAMAFYAAYYLFILNNKDYSLEVIIAVFYSCVSGATSLSVSTGLISTMGRAKSAAVDVFTLIDDVITIDSKLSTGSIVHNFEGNIKFKDVTFAYPSQNKLALKSVSFSVGQGESIAIVGQTGSGKTTISNLLLRFYDVLSGNIYLDGVDIRTMSVRWLRNQIGWVSQDPMLFNTTVRENIRYGRVDVTNEQVVKAAKLAHAHEFIKSLPMGYDTVVGKLGKTLSVAQKHHIAMARALVRNPKILIFDEATSALDKDSEEEFLQAFSKIQRGRTTIMIAHRLNTVRDVDNIYVLKYGEVVEIGCHELLMALQGIYHTMWKIQQFGDGLDEDGSKIKRKHALVPSASSSVDIVGGITRDRSTDAAKEQSIEVEALQVKCFDVFKLAKPEWFFFLLGILCAIALGICNPLITSELANILTTIAKTSKWYVQSQATSISILFVVIAFGAGILNFFECVFIGIASERLTYRLRNMLFENYLRQDLMFFKQPDNPPGLLCTRLSEDTAAVQAGTEPSVALIPETISTLVYSVILSFCYDARVASLSFVFILIVAGVSFVRGTLMNRQGVIAVQRLRLSTKLAVEAVENISTVCWLGLEKRMLSRFLEKLVPVAKVSKRESHWRGIFLGLSRGIFNFVYPAALIYAASIMYNEGVDVPSLKAAQALIMASSTTSQASSFAASLMNAYDAGRRIVVSLREGPNIVSAEVTEPFTEIGNIAMENVFFKYASDSISTKWVLTNFSMNVPQGAKVTLIGANACGKTTVVQLLLRFYIPNAGYVAFNDVNISDVNIQELRKKMAWVQQEPVLFSRTIKENIEYGDNSRKIDMAEIINVAKQAHVHDFIVSLPEGYNTSVGSKGALLSGGEKQCITIARALIRNPQLLILDEAVSALDPESALLVEKAIEMASAGRTCLFITQRVHRLNKEDDFIYVMGDHGGIVEKGTYKQLMKSRGVYYTMCSE